MPADRRSLYERTVRVGLTELAVAILAFALGAYSLLEGRVLGYVRFGIPGAGFFPIYIGVALVLASIPLALRAWGRRHRRELADWGMIVALMVAMFVLLLATSVVGLVPALFLFAAGAIPMLGRINPLVAVLVAAGATLTIWATFEGWLGIPLPRGLFGA